MTKIQLLAALWGFRNLSSFPQVRDMRNGTLGDTKGEAQNTLHVQEFWI